MNLTEVRSKLRASAKPGDAEFLQRFFKTGPGQYGEGDLFLGGRVPTARALAKQCDLLPWVDLTSLLHSRYHEERLLALLILVRRFQRGTEPERRAVYDFYLASTRWINNWDLVDLSAYHIIGAWLLERSREPLLELVVSPMLWERRIAVVCTYAFIRAGQFNDTLELSRRLLNDGHDLMHKACGWMLREVGKRDQAVLAGFLEQHSRAMPRTMLRYAIERFPEPERRAWLTRST